MRKWPTENGFCLFILNEFQAKHEMNEQKPWEKFTS